MIKRKFDALGYLESHIVEKEKKYPREKGLKRTKKLLKLLGQPQFAYPSIHIAGTSGKGSTASIISNILGQNYRVGLYTSPHLCDVRERIKIIDKKFSKMISKTDFGEYLNTLRPFISKIEESSLDTLSYFEILTALAFFYFRQKKVDIAIIEVGLGGKYDATNVLQPVISVLTNIGLDHTDILGKTLKKIAEEKLGIIKPQACIISGVKQPSVIKVVEKVTYEKNGKLFLLGRDFFYKIKNIDSTGSYFHYFGRNAYQNLRLNLLGAHQIENAVLAIKSLEELVYQLEIKKIEHKFLIREEDIRSGLRKIFIPGRMEIVNQYPLIILDGAHNPDKAKALANAIHFIYKRKKVTAIIAIKEDKDAQGILRKIIPICENLIFTKFSLNGDIGRIRSYNPNMLRSIAKKINNRKKYSIAPSIKQAVGYAQKLANKDDLILITGSLYLVGEIKKMML